MKLTDVNKDLTEAPGDFGKRLKKTAKGVGRTAKLKVQKKLSPTQKGRRVASAKDDVRTQAKQIKADFAVWMASTKDEGKIPTVKNFVNFIKAEKNDLANLVQKIGMKYNFIKKLEPKSEPERKSEPENKKGGKPAPEKYSPEELAKIKAKFKSGAEEAGAETEAQIASEEKQDVKASKGDEKESKVDTSASIYEARLAAMLFERDLSDNELDTFIVRLIQAKNKQGKRPEPEAKPKPKSRIEPEQKSEPKTKVGKAPAKQKAEPAVTTDDDDSFKIRKVFQRPLEGILKKVYSGGEFDQKEKKDAKRIYDSI